MLIKMLLLFISFQNLYAEDFFMRMSAGKVNLIQIEKFDSMKVSSACLKQSQQCSHLILKKFKSQRTFVSNKDAQFGNPASMFCKNGGGTNIILEDNKNNEYDFCKISENFLVDSWDLLKRYKP